jgi:aspartate racemase
MSNRHWPARQAPGSLIGMTTERAMARPLDPPLDADRGFGVLGILGGMGPMATIDLAAKIIALTPALRDQDHLPMVIASMPQIPSRVAAISRDGPSPLPAMLAALARLRAAGAERVAIACNTAHVWRAQLAAASPLPIFDMIVLAVGGLAPDDHRVAVIGTSGTRQAGLYGDALCRTGREPVELDPAQQRELIDTAIDRVKAGHRTRRALFEAAHGAGGTGAQRIILARTEVPIAFERLPAEWCALTLDAATLARACVAWSLGAAGPMRHNRAHGSEMA